MLISIPSAPDAVKSASIRFVTFSSASFKILLMVNVISLAVSVITVSLLRIGFSVSAVEKAFVNPPKIRPGSIKTNITGIISRAMTATMIFPICFRPAHRAPATAP